MKSPIKINTPEIGRQELLNLLTQYQIPTDEWGKESAKTIDHLLNEINGGEATLVEDKESCRLLRKFSFLAIDVVCWLDDNIAYRLREDRQVFNADGRVRRRGLEMSIGEKIKSNETNIEVSAKRAIAEELGIKDGYSIEGGEQIIELTNSMSYPGLQSIRVRHNMLVRLEVSQYNPDGYTEVQADKTSYFVWEKI